MHDKESRPEIKRNEYTNKIKIIRRKKTLFMKTKKVIIISLTLIGLLPVTNYAQIAINTLGSNPDASAILDLNTGNAGVNKGFLPPHVQPCLCWQSQPDYQPCNRPDSV